MKFELYRNAASLKDYLLVAQDRIHVEHYSRQPEGTWVLWETNDLSASVALPSLDVELPLSDIYARIDFN